MSLLSRAVRGRKKDGGVARDIYIAPIRLLLRITIPQGQGKILYRGKTLFWLFRKSFHDNGFHCGRNVHALRIDGRRRSVKMLGSNFDLRTAKRGISAEPLVNHDTEGILIACRAWLAHNL